MKATKMGEVGVWVVGLTVAFFIFFSPTFAYSGPYPEEATAYFEWKAVTHAMIAIIGCVIGAIMIIRGRTPR